MPDFSFRKAERLTSRKSISFLFREGKSLSSFPLRILFAAGNDQKFPAAVAIAVPKRLFKRAVDRNLLKRRIREAYRIHKPVMYARLLKMNVRARLVIQYQHKEILDYKGIESGLQKGLEKMLKELEISGQ